MCSLRRWSFLSFLLFPPQFPLLDAHLCQKRVILIEFVAFLSWQECWAELHQSTFGQKRSWNTCWSQIGSQRGLCRLQQLASIYIFPKISKIIVSLVQFFGSVLCPYFLFDWIFIHLPLLLSFISC